MLAARRGPLRGSIGGWRSHARDCPMAVEPDLSDLRERADRGDTSAADELIEMAAERGDLGELRRLADGGNAAAADQLIESASELGDLDELRRMAAAGNTTAADQLI